MISIITLILPVFLIIFLGWLVRKLDWVDSGATRELNKYVVFLALPALLFDIVIRTDWPTVWQSSSFSQFALSFTLITFLVFGTSLWLQAKLGHSIADATIQSISGAYSNTAYIGYPLLIAVAGEDSKPYVLCATIITVCALFAISIIIVEINRDDIQLKRRHIVRQALLRVCKMPLVVAPALATLLVSLKIDLPTAVSMPVNMLGLSAAPCALVTIGFFLGGRASTRKQSSTTKAAEILPVNSFLHKVKGFQKNLTEMLSKSTNQASRVVMTMVVSKLVIHPALIYFVSIYLFTLNPTALVCIVVLAALPTGTGPFMLAELYEREASKTSDTILISTLLSPITLAITLWLINANNSLAT